jgi:hypothetical protein
MPSGIGPLELLILLLFVGVPIAIVAVVLSRR